MDIGEFARMALSYTHPNGSVGQNVFYWELQSATCTDEELADAVDDWITNDWGPEWTNIGMADATIIQADLDIVNGDGTVDRNIGTESYSIAGNSSAIGLAPGVAGFIQATTDTAKTVGKKYVPYLGVASIDDGIWISATVSVLAQLFADYISPLVPAVGAVLAAGVVSRVTETFHEFTGGGLITDIPAYQRRRKPNVGS